MSKAETRRWMVSGRVQGVFFRESTRREAEKLGLSGRAVNLPDGRVEVVACGEPNAIDELQRWLAKGPPAASVEAVEPADPPGSVPATDKFITG